MEKEFLGETAEERMERFYHIMKMMNECGEIEFLHALSSVCIETAALLSVRPPGGPT